MDASLERLKSIHSHLSEFQNGMTQCEVEKLTDGPLRVLVTGAAGQIAYSLVGLIASGAMLGKQQKVILHLLDIPPMSTVLQGVVYELQDCAYPLLCGLIATTKPEEAFRDVDIACLVGAMPRKEGMERKDLLKANAKIFEEQGRLLNTFASRTVKVVVVGNPANTNALIAARNAPNIPRENFSALTRLDQNRARSQIAMKLGVPVQNVRNVIIWGNHSATQYPDIFHGTVQHYPSTGLISPVSAVIKDIDWVKKEFIPSVQQRGALVIKARKLSSAASAAKAICDHIHDWLLGTQNGEIVSMAVISDGSYGIPEGIVFSFPVVCRKGGEYKIIHGFELNELSRQYLKLTTEELIQEKTLVGL